MKSLNLFACLGCGIVLTINIASTERGEKKNDYVNLQVLPKDITTKELQHIMVDEFQDGLGIGCGYCHATQKESILLDYASDEKPEKEIARKMMRMTLEINKSHFGIDNPEIGNGVIPVSCYTCHRGAPHPESE